MSEVNIDTYISAEFEKKKNLKIKNDRHRIFNIFFPVTATLLKGHVHIGLNDIEEEGKFIYTDGSEPLWSNWYSTNPNGNNAYNCVVAYYSYNFNWDDVSCLTKYGALIEILASNLKNECFEGRVIIL